MSQLPLYFVIKRYRPNIEDDYPRLEPFKDLSVLIQSKKNPDSSWSLELVKNPLQLIEGSNLITTENDVWFNGRIVEIAVSKYNTPSTLTMRIKFNNTVFVNSEFSYSIPLLKIDKPTETLAREFYNLPENLEYGFDLNNLSVTIPEQKEPKLQEIKIPAHIMATYIQSLLDKKELCPITMEPLQRDTLYITECGHAMSKSAARKWITQKKSCPVCRVKCSFCG